MHRETSRGDTLYCFGLDLLALGWMVSFFVVGSVLLVLRLLIFAVLSSEILRARFLRMLERFLVRRTDLVVCTSEHYVNDYYAGCRN